MKKPEQKIQLNAYIPYELHRELKLMAVQIGTTMSKIVIRAIRRELEEIRKEGKENGE